MRNKKEDGRLGKVKMEKEDDGDEVEVDGEEED